MIHDSLSAAARKYYAVHPLFCRAFEFLTANFDRMLDPASDGKEAIEGDDLFVMIGDHSLKEPENARLEVHDRYIDIQLLLVGAENFGWAQRTACTLPEGEMNSEKDILFFDDLPTSVVTALPGEFVVFFPEDAHAPLMRPLGEVGKVRKAIVKVKVK